MSISSHIKKEPRALPVFILLDTSGSMRGEKIETVNVALKEMINTFKKIENPKGIIEMCLITFGGDDVRIIKELSKVEDKDVYTLDAGGKTPMGKVFEKVSELIEDTSVVSDRAYTPTIVLISDGVPTDYDCSNKTIEDMLEWEALKKIHNGKRASIATKLAMRIGEDANVDVLKAFINNKDIPVILAKDNSTVVKFFQWLTMAVSVRSVSSNPNQATYDDISAFDDIEIEF